MNDHSTAPPPGLITWVAANRVKSGVALMAAGIALSALPVVLAAWYGRDFLGVEVLTGILAALLLVAGVWQRFRPRDAGSPVDEARMLVLTLGGLAGLIVALTGIVLLAQYWDTLTRWLRLGEREGAWRVLVSLAVLLGGLALMFVSLQAARTEVRHNPVLRRLLYGYNAVFAGVLLFLILAVVNVLAYLKLPSVLDSTEAGLTNLSDRSIQVLKAMDKPATVYVMMPTDYRVYEDLRTLLSRAQDYAPRMRVETLSTGLSATRIRELVKQFPQVGTIDSEGVLLTYGEEKPEASFIRAEDLLKSEPTPDGDRTVIFEGESRIMTELSFLAENKQKPVVYFTHGNAGEMDFNDADPSKETAVGALQRRLAKRNFDVRPLTFDVADPKVPDDATLVVVPGPRQPFTTPAVAALRKYLDERKGKLVALLGVPPAPSTGDAWPSTGLEALLGAYNVQPANERVLSLWRFTEFGDRDPESTLATTMNTDALRSQNPVAVTFREAAFQLYQSRVVRPAPSGNPQLRAETLLQTVPGILPVWAESNLRAAPRLVANLMYQDRKELAARVSRSSLPLAVSVTESAAAPPPMMGGPPPAAKPRMVVFGSSVFVSNAFVDEQRGDANFDLFASTLDWLRERPSNIGIAPHIFKTYKLDPTASFQGLAFIPAVLALVGIAGLGVGVWVVRRR